MIMKKNSSLLSYDYDHDHHKNKKKVIIGCSSSSTANGEEDELTEDLILEIFSHLPPISLLRFKSVSKSFHSLISNPDFLRRNTVHQFGRQDPSPPPLPPGILLKRDGLCGDSKILIFPPLPIHGYGHQHYGYSTQLLQNLIDYQPEHDRPEGDEKVIFRVIDSCNGLLLLCLNCFRDENPPKYIWYVCNPITKDYIKLPTFEEKLIGFKILGYWLPYWSGNLVFDPSLSLTYKVVIWLREDGAWRLYVYSSETRSWRLSVSLNINDFRFHVLEKQSSSDYRAVLLNGVLYWSTLIATTMIDVFDVLLCYDLKKDSVWTLKFPKMPVGYVCRKLYYFGVCGGGLRLIEKYYKPLV